MSSKEIKNRTKVNEKEILGGVAGIFYLYSVRKKDPAFECKGPPVCYKVLKCSGNRVSAFQWVLFHSFEMLRLDSNIGEI